MPSEMRAPYRMVDRMSRPWLSLPRGNARSPPSIQAGGLNAAFRSSAAAANGSCGDSQGEKRAAPTQISVSAAATTVTGDLRKLQARSWSQALRMKWTRRSSREISASPADAREARLGPVIGLVHGGHGLLHRPRPQLVVDRHVVVLVARRDQPLAQQRVARPRV